MSTTGRNRPRSKPLPPSPTRDKILDALRTYDGALSPKRLSAITGIEIGLMAYHVRALREAGVIKLVKETRVRGAIEHHYELNEGYEGDLADPLVGLQKLCGVLTLPTPGGYPRLVELDDEARRDMQQALDTISPWVERIVTEAAKRAAG